MPRLVTVTCPRKHVTGFNVEDDATGEREVVCSACDAMLVLVLDRTEPARRPGHTPLQREELLRERAQLLRRTLELLECEVSQYLKRLDVSPEDLPAASPLRHAIERARLELAKRDPAA